MLTLLVFLSAGTTSSIIPDLTAGYYAFLGDAAEGQTFASHTSRTSGLPYWIISNVTTSGTITNYNILPSGATYTNYGSNLVVDSSGNVWFAGCGNAGAILGEADTSTDTVTLSPFTGAGGSNTPCGSGWDIGDLTIDASGNIWLASSNYTWDSTILTEFTSSGSYAGYYYTFSSQEWSGAVAGPGNSLYLTDWTNNKIDKVALSSTTDEVAGINTYTIPTTNSYPANIIVGPDGNLWFTEGSSAKIGTMAPSGTFTEYAIPSGDEPDDITAGPDGALWFTTSPSTGSTYSVGRITTGGSMTEYAVPTSNSEPIGITAGPDDALWFTEFAGGKIGRLGY